MSKRPPSKTDAENLPFAETVESTPPEMVSDLIARAIGLGASDLFLASNEEHLEVAVRRHGLLRPVATVGPEFGKRCLAYIKTQAQMDVTERRRPQDGRWAFTAPGGRGIDIRINSIPTLHGEDFALRLLERDNKLLSVQHLGMLQRDLNSLLGMLNAPSGLILVSGPTGSGKTTTLYNCLRELANGQRKINTIEDPIEYSLENIRQSQVSLAAEVGFPELLRSVLRQAPDVIMVGEIRDTETALIAVQAANSGHLVLATLHAPITSAAVQSLLGFGIQPYMLATSLIGIVSQRLVRRLCPETRIPVDITMFEEMFNEVRGMLRPGEGEKIYAPNPKSSTSPDGYVGRLGIFEVMPISSAIRGLIVRKQPSHVIRAKAIEEGMVGLRQAALVAIARGETSVEELFRCIPSEYLESSDVDHEHVMKAE